VWAISANACIKLQVYHFDSNVANSNDPPKGTDKKHTEMVTGSLLMIWPIEGGVVAVTVTVTVGTTTGWGCGCGMGMGLGCGCGMGYTGCTGFTG
jgi:hypothetical protein